MPNPICLVTLLLAISSTAFAISAAPTIPDDFTDPARWVIANSTKIRGFFSPGYKAGQLIDGRWAIFYPETSDWPAPYNENVVALQYDTTKPFDDPLAWESFDLWSKLALTNASSPVGSASITGMFQSKEMLYMGGMTAQFVFGYNTTMRNFSNPDAWIVADMSAFRSSAFAVSLRVNATLGYWSSYDSEILKNDLTGGRSVVDALGWTSIHLSSLFGANSNGQPVPATAPVSATMIPGHPYIYWNLGNGWLIRNQIDGAFSDHASWTAVDLSAWAPESTGQFGGGCTADSQFLYCTNHFSTFEELVDAAIVKYKFSANFTDPASYEFFKLPADIIPQNLTMTTPSYVYPFVHFGPRRFSDNTPGTVFVRYDTRQSLNARSAWSRMDISTASSIPAAGFLTGLTVNNKHIIYLPTARDVGFVRYDAAFDPGCVGIPPSSDFVCRNGTWTIFSNVTVTGVMNMTQSTKIEGNLEINSTATIVVTATSRVEVTGCFQPGGTLLLAVKPGDIDASGLKNMTLLTFDRYCDNSGASPQFDTVTVGAVDPGECAQMNQNLEYGQRDITVLFTVDRSGCAPNVDGVAYRNFLLTVIVPSVGGAVILVILISVIAVKCRAARKKVFPYADRSDARNTL